MAHFQSALFHVLFSSVVDEVWQEQTLLRLLHLVELPLLEGVLQCCQLASSSPSHSNPDLIYSSNHLDRRILQAFRDSQYVGLHYKSKGNDETWLHMYRFTSPRHSF